MSGLKERTKRLKMNSVKDIFDTYKLHTKDIEIPLEQVKLELQPYENKIVLYGAGSAGIAFLHYLIDAEIFPCYFADGDKEKHGKICEGLEVIAPESIIERVGSDAMVIVTINTDGKSYCKDFKKELLAGGHQGVHRRLKECGCSNVIDYTYFRRCYQLFQGEKYNLPACSDVYSMLENQDLIEKAFSVMEDDMTKSTFLKLLEFRLLTDQVDIPTLPEKGMYFEYDLFPKINGEVFIDCGACGGSSLSDFLEINHHCFKAYYGIEPDKTNYGKLEKFVAQLPENEQEKMKIYHAAAYDKDGETNFFILNGPGSFQAYNGPDRIKTIKIDDILDKGEATYIKMNIEGSEVAALKGAEYTIRNYHPRMAIMGYHKTSDFWEVPLLMKEYYGDYHLSLRSYMRNVAFAYYAF